jgi:predicted RND superfamily exporter protein
VHTANQVYASAFPEAASTSDLLILVTRTVPADWPRNDSTVLTEVTAGFTQQVMQKCIEYEPTDMWRGTQGYFIDIHSNYSGLASEFVSADGLASMIAVSYDSNGDVNDFIHSFEDIISDGLAFPPGTDPAVAAQYELSITGLDLLFDDTVTESEHDFILMDGIVLPVALVVLALYLRNLRMMLIPLASVGLTILCSFTVMYRQYTSST